MGASICGTNGELWGRVVAEEPTCWRLDSGRIAKKETEGYRWAWEQVSQKPRTADVYSMLFCRVCLGNPYLIEGNLLASSAMHDVCWCQDPTEQLETTAEDWSLARGHDTYYVRGLSGRSVLASVSTTASTLSFSPSKCCRCIVSTMYWSR